MKLNQKWMPHPKGLAIVIGMLLLLLTLGLSLIPRTPTAAATSTPTDKARKCKFYHKVQPGDTIIYLGQLYQYDWRDIAEANKLKEPYVLTPGDRLCIPGGVRPEIVDSETGEGKTVTAKAEPTGTVVGNVGHVYLKLEHFPKNRIYNVIIRPRTTNQFYRLNCFFIDNLPAPGPEKEQCRSIHTDEKGFFEGWLRIPTYIPNAPLHELCIKDVWTDETLCTNFEDPEYYLEQVNYMTHKFGH